MIPLQSMLSIRLTGLKTALRFIKAAGGTIHDAAMYVVRNVLTCMRTAQASILFDEFCILRKEETKVQPCDWWEAGVLVTMCTDSLTAE